MNKQECKKYIKRAFKELEKQKNNITLEDFKLEIMKQISKDNDLYVSSAMLAFHTILNSANEINAKQVTEEIDVIPEIYNESEIVIIAKNLS